MRSTGGFAASGEPPRQAVLPAAWGRDGRQSVDGPAHVQATGWDIPAYHRPMARLLLLIVGLALVGLGAYWRWFEPRAATRPVVTDLATAVRMVREGDGRIPVRIDAAPDFVRVHRTRLIRPGYAACRIDDPAVDWTGDATDPAPAGTGLGCRRRVDAPLEAGGWRIEQTASDNLGQQVVCLRVLLHAVSGTNRRLWYATSPAPVSTERACRMPVRARFPWALPNTQVRYAAVGTDEAATLADAERAWNADGRSGYLTRIDDLAYNQFWRDESLEALARAIDAAEGPAAGRPRRALVAGRELGLPTPASLLLVDTPAGRMSVKSGATAVVPSPPWQGVIDVPGMLEGRFVAGMEDEQPLWASLELGAFESLDADVAETAVFSMGLGGFMLVLAGVLHAGVALRRGVARS